MHHSHFIVQLNQHNFSLLRNLAGRQHLEHCPVPLAHHGEEIRVQVADNILRLMILVDVGYLGILAEDPWRNSFVDCLCIDVRSWSGDDQQAHFGCQVQKASQVPHGMTAAIKV